MGLEPLFAFFWLREERIFTASAPAAMRGTASPAAWAWSVWAAGRGRAPTVARRTRQGSGEILTMGSIQWLTLDRGNPKLMETS